ncbi:recombinase RecA [Limnoglobus roseus]|uniref:Protein RecA n=1 Tax=Limnoglobus roseus TaxID=2598579 RepID=A0A5C1AD35_9BACT|nr:recombinase RecA [Limnoglobus roseus]QEL14968.1 recombinase RecA [Limnoglobus roseus]
MAGKSEKLDKSNNTFNKDILKVQSEINKEFGEGSIMSLGDVEVGLKDIVGIPTGSLALDLALGGKGLPRGRVIEIYGNESSGKTTIALHTIANAQKQGGVAAFIDAEHALDPTWARKIGVDLESLLVSQPSYGEEALRIAEMLVKSNAVDIIVIDSVAALVPKAELNNEIGDSSVGVQARLMSQALRILNPLINKTKTCVIFINQIRQKIGVMYGNPETTTGGLALKFYASVRLEVRKAALLKDGDEAIGTEMKVKVVKNKIAAPFATAEMELYYDHGIDLENDVLKIGEEEEIVTKSGAFWSYGETRLGQGKDNARAFLRENPEIRDTIIKQILDKRHGDPTALLEAPEGSEEDTSLEDEPAPTPKKRGGKAAAAE